MSTALYILPRLYACEEPQPALQLVPAIGLEPAPEPVPVPPRLAFYRKYTEGMLRRYMRFSLEAGRVPSMLGREMFLGKASHYRINSFEDVVIFVHDVENSLARLERMQQLLILRIAVQEYTQEETAAMLGLPFRTVRRHYHRSIDALTDVFLKSGLLDVSKSCQEGKAAKKVPTSTKQKR